MILSKAGYGSIDVLKSYDSYTFMSLLQYENFVMDYRDEMTALNKRIYDMAKVGDLFVDLSFKGDGALSSIGNLITKIGLLEFGLDRIQQGFDKVFGDSLKNAVGLQNFNTQTGFSIEQMQKWKAIAVQNGIALEDVLGSYKKLQQNRTDLMMGQGNATGYGMLGIDPRQDPEKVMDQIKEKLSGLDKSMQRFFLNQFGLSENMMVWFNLSDEQMDNYNKKLALTEDEVKSLNELNREWVGLTTDLGNAWDKTMANVADTVVDVIKYLREMVATIQEIIESSDNMGEAIDRVLNNISAKFDQWSENNKFVAFIKDFVKFLYWSGEKIGEGLAWTVDKVDKGITWANNRALQSDRKDHFNAKTGKWETYAESRGITPMAESITRFDRDMAERTSQEGISTGGNNQTIIVEGSEYNITAPTTLTKDDLIDIDRTGKENLIVNIGRSR